MIVDPMQVITEVLKTTTGTSALTTTTSSGQTTTTGVSPVPTVVPTLPEYQEATETGERTLW